MPITVLSSPDNPHLSHRDLVVTSIGATLLAAVVGMSYVYFDLSMNRAGMSASAIGLNAAMPALGWLLATPLMGAALRRFTFQSLIGGLLTFALLAALAVPVWNGQGEWLFLRFVFGGCTGMTFRLVEYGLNATSAPQHRGRNIGIYAACFCLGAGSGAAVLPIIGLEGWPPILTMAGMMAAATITLTAAKCRPTRAERPPSPFLWKFLHRPVIATILGGLIFGLFDAVPYTLMPVYLVRAGLDGQTAALSITAFLFGQIVLLVPIGEIADRWGKRPCLIAAATGMLAITVFLPATITCPVALMTAIALWGGLAGSLYILSLAMLADDLNGGDLITANALFGTLYAAGNLIGPLLHGMAMDWRNPDGLLFSAGALVTLFLALRVQQTWPSRRQS